MTSPLSRISAGSFFTGLICEYSSLGWPGTTVAGTNSILSISPSSIAAMRTLRAKGEAGEKDRIMANVLEKYSSEKSIRHCEERKRRSNPVLLCGVLDCFAELVIGRAFARPVGSQ